VAEPFPEVKNDITKLSGAVDRDIRFLKSFAGELIPRFCLLQALKNLQDRLSFLARERGCAGVLFDFKVFYAEAR
jgi:hypothetical protein